MEIALLQQSTCSMEQLIAKIEKLEEEKEKLSAVIVDLSVSAHRGSNFCNKGGNAIEGFLFCDLMEVWLNWRSRRLSPNTAQEYRKVLTKHIIPYFKTKRLTVYEISGDDIEDYYAYLISQGISPNTVLKHHANIYSAFKYACDKGIIIVSPMKDVERPQPVKFTPNYYCPEQLMQLFHVAKSTELYTPILLASLLGLRRSEIVGLMWDCIDFYKNTITIKRKAVKLKGKPDDLVMNKLKTQSSYRTLSLPPILADYLKQLKGKQDSQLKSNPLYNKKNYQYVCVNSKGNRLTLQYITDSFRRLIRYNGLDILRFHDLRHSCATMLLYFGYNTKQIQEWLGHSDIKTTLSYTHLYSNEKSVMAARISKEFNLNL